MAAVDVGTTATKAALIDRNGNVLASASHGYPTRTAPGGVVEQDPRHWWEGACRALRDCRPSDFRVAALVVSGQMQNLISVGPSRVPVASTDGAGEPGILRPAILYSDGRAVAEADHIRRSTDAERWRRVTGASPDAGGLAAKLLWLRRHEPHVYTEARHFLFGAHDYVVWRALGVPMTDPTTASTTQILDVERGTWADGLLTELTLRTDALPPLGNPGRIIGPLPDAAADALGLPAGTPVVQGAGDAATATLGAGAGEPGRTYLYLGTSGWLAATVDGRSADRSPAVLALLHPDPRHRLLIGPMMTAAGNLEWVRRQLGNPPYDRLSAMAAAAPPGSGGVRYYPYPAGERSPFQNPHARASFTGLSTATEPEHLVRAVMEGVAFALRTIAEAMPGGERLYAAGGGARSDVWCRIIAAVLQRPVYRLAQAEDVGVRGAAVVAGRALSWHDGWYPGDEFFPVEAVFEPDEQEITLYNEEYLLFVEGHPYFSAPDPGRG